MITTKILPSRGCPLCQNENDSWGNSNTATNKKELPALGAGGDVVSVQHLQKTEKKEMEGLKTSNFRNPVVSEDSYEVLPGETKWKKIACSQSTVLVIMWICTFILQTIQNSGPAQSSLITFQEILNIGSILIQC